LACASSSSRRGAHIGPKTKVLEHENGEPRRSKAFALNDIFRHAHVRDVARSDTSGRLFPQVVPRKVCSDAEPSN
jgi:hypothetical protein